MRRPDRTKGRAPQRWALRSLERTSLLRTLISVLAGAGLLFGAYVISFGVPERLAPYLGAAAGAEAAPSAEARDEWVKALAKARQNRKW